MIMKFDNVTRISSLAEHPVMETTPVAEPEVDESADADADTDVQATAHEGSQDEAG